MKFKVGTKEYEIADDKITEAITNKTSVMTLVEDVIVRSKDEDDAFVENMKKDARKEGVEIAVKKYREEKGLDFQGKTIENLISAISDKVLKDAQLTPDEAVKKVNEKLKEKETALKNALERAEQAENSAKTLKSDLKITKAIESAIPKNTVLPVEDIVTILKSKMTFKENEDGVIEIFDQQGKKLTNSTTADALGPKDAIEDFFRNNTHYVQTPGGGAGGDDSKGGKDGKMTLEKFNEVMKEKGHEINSPGYTEELNKALKDKTVDVD